LQDLPEVCLLVPHVEILDQPVHNVLSGGGTNPEFTPLKFSQAVTM
jgi:hypothetical protein